jgi:hypothetical protein
MPWLVILTPLIAGPLVAQVASLPLNGAPVGSQAGLVVLQNGEVLTGHVVPSGERVLVTLPGREISLRPGEIDVVASTLSEAYRLKRTKIRPTDVSGRLDLAAWCLRQNLLESAAEELAVAAQVQPFEPRLKALQQRLDKAVERRSMATRASYQQPVPAGVDSGRNSVALAAARGNPASDRTDNGKLWPPSAAPHGPIIKPTTRSEANSQPQAGTAEAESPVALERFVRSLPARAVEEFTVSLQPMITRSCATAGCHAPGNQTQFTLLRLPQGRTASRRLTQRNLYNAAQLVDFARPEESRLLKVASQPHGPLKAGVFGDQRSPKYRELSAWVSRLTGVPINRDEPANVETTPSIAWDHLQRSAVRAPASEQARLEAVLDQLEPNRPAEIKSQTALPTTAKTAAPEETSSRPFFKQTRAAFK